MASALRSPTTAPAPASAELYLELLKRCLTRVAFQERYAPIHPGDHRGPLRRVVYAGLRRLLAARGYEIVRPARVDPTARVEGRDWPLEAETMIGLHRLDNLQECVTNVLRDGVPGDLVEAGVWRGGATILMRAVLKVHESQDRRVWVADSFKGLPRPDPRRYPKDAGDQHWTQRLLAVSIDEVRANFDRYGLLDEQVRFLPGWFSDTLVNAPIDRLAVLRIDADMYQSTMEALRYLYPKVSAGGYIIIDDYGAVAGCKAAVDDFRAAQRITDELVRIDWGGVFWRRPHGAVPS